MGNKTRILRSFAALLICVFLNSRTVEVTNSLPAITILDISGKIEFARTGWMNKQPLHSGTLIGTGDFIYPNHASLVVLCPDGTPKTFLSTELFDNDIIECPIDPQKYIIGVTGLKSLNFQRGRRQDSTIPYLVSPRETLIRNPTFSVIWNAPPNLTNYTLIIRSGKSIIWKSSSSDLSIQNGVGYSKPSVALQPDFAYTIEICAQSHNLHIICTTDPGLNDIDSAFYYRPNANLDNVLGELGQDLQTDSPQSLFARAIVLKYYSGFSLGKQLGYFQEAIDSLEQLLSNYPNSQLAKTPELYNELGQLYLSINLELNAAKVFNKALSLASSGTESSALAALGNGISTPNNHLVLGYFNRALNDFATYLSGSAFQMKFQEICQLIGDICPDLERCRDEKDICTTWYKGGQI